MATRRTFLLVFMDGGASLGGAGSPAATAPALPALREVVGLSGSELGTLRFDEQPLFDMSGARATEGPEAVDQYLTVVALRTILHQLDPSLETVVVPAAALSASPDAIRERTGGDPVATGVSSTFAFSADEVVQVARRARALFPATPLILGGAGLTLNPSWFEDADADWAILGDAEPALPQLVRALMGSGPEPASIPNLLYRDASGTLRTNPRAQFPADEIPVPRWDLAQGAWPRLVWYESQRGCPFRCAFCSYPNQALCWDVKSPQRMVEEFELFSRNGVETIQCFDSSMVTPPHRMAAFCSELRGRALPVRWHCYAHAANLQDPRLTRAMFDAGCRSVSIGLESCDENVLRMMNKHVSPDGIARAVASCTSAGLVCAANMIVGFPGETLETYRRTVDRLAELEPDSVAFQPFQVRDRTIPILHGENAHLLVDEGPRPRWRHDGMDRDQAARLAIEAVWELALRTKRTILPLVGSAARAPLAPAATRRASLFRRERVNPIIAAYGRFLCLAPQLAWMDGPLRRPTHIPARSAVEAADARDRCRHLWDEAVTAASRGEWAGDDLPKT